MPTPFLAKQDQLEAKIEEWTALAGPKLTVNHLTTYSGHAVYALTLTDETVACDRKRAHYFAQPHAHEPGTTAGMMDVLEQLVTGKNLAGEPAALDRGKVLAETILTFNPIGNPDGRERAPVLYWDGSKYSNEEFWCWMRGEDPDNPGKMWKRLGLWDDREEKAPDPVGIVYEQIDEHRYVEPNRSQLSTYFKLFHQMDKQHHYEAWLDLHQCEFTKGDADCMMVLPYAGANEGKLKEDNEALAQSIIRAWQAAGFTPTPDAVELGYTGVQGQYFRDNWGPLHKRMNVLITEVKTNAPDATPEFQTQAQVIAVIKSIERLLK